MQAQKAATDHQSDQQFFHTAVALLCLFVALPLLFISIDNYWYSRSLLAIWDLGHVPLFFCLVYLLLRLLPRICSMSVRRRLLVALITGLAAGGTLELLQYFISGREMSITDIFNDLNGAILVAAWSGRNTDSREVNCLIWIRLASILFLALALVPLALALTDEYRARKHFPTLLQGMSRLELSRFSSTEELALENNAVRIALQPAKYSGFSLRYFPRNWQSYSAVNLELELQRTNSISLTCRINDVLHDQDYSDRYNGQFQLSPGIQTISIDLNEVRLTPLKREMNMKEIGAIGCFISGLESPEVLVLYRIYLL